MQRTYKTTGDVKTNLRSRATLDSNSVMRLSPGTTLTMLDIEHRDHQTWIRVKTEGGNEGFVLDKYLEEV